MSPPTITARLRRTWSDKLLQLEDLRPKNSSAVLLDWTEEGAVDAGVPETMAKAIAIALVSIGSVAFRWDGDCAWPADQATVIKPPNLGVVQTAIQRITHRWHSDVIVTHDVSVTMRMFDHDWESQGQAALVFDATLGLDETVRAELAARRDWRDFDFGRSTRILLSPAVDGDAVLISAVSDLELQRITEAIWTSLDNAHIGLDDE